MSKGNNLMVGAREDTSRGGVVSSNINMRVKFHAVYIIHVRQVKNCNIPALHDILEMAVEKKASLAAEKSAS